MTESPEFWDGICFAVDDSNYSLFSAKWKDQDIPVAPVSRGDGSVVCVIPTKAWPKAWKDRLFQKEQGASLVMTGVCETMDLQGTSCGEARVAFVEMSEKLFVDTVSVTQLAEVSFANRTGDAVWPSGSALTALFKVDAEEDFKSPGSASAGEPAATSTARTAPVESGEASKDMEVRMVRMESVLDVIQGALVEIKSKNQRETSPSARASQQTANASKSLPPALKASFSADTDFGRLGLDPSVLKDAAAAGISSSQLAKISHMLDPAKSFPREPQQRAKANMVLGDSDSEDGAGDQDESMSKVDKAIVQMGRMAKHLSHASKNQDALPNAESNSAVSGAGDSRRYIALCQKVVESPASIIAEIERLMAQANGSSGDSLATSRPDPLFYLEHRSRVENYQTNAIWTTAMATIARCLQRGQNEEALARALLSLAGGEQFSQDRGSWVGGFEVMCMQDPPYHNLARHTADSTPLNLGSHSSLVSPNWYHAIQSHLQFLDSTRERKEKLQKLFRAPTFHRVEPKKHPGGVKGDPKGPKGDGKGKNE